LRKVPVLFRSEGARLLDLAARREVKFGDALTIRTPLLIPSFSSRVPDADKPLRASEEFIDGPLLISAYDVKHGLLSPPYDFGSAIFLDTGGYEIARSGDLSDVGDHVPGSLPWSEHDHGALLELWNPRIPSAIISYDHPKQRSSVGQQIARTKKMSLRGPDMAREILLKPETKDQDLIQIESVLHHVRDLAAFDIVGVTEKEIGNSVLDRMINIGRLRAALTKIGLETPIHVFGSLDTVTTLFYFVAGADVFDGLTWLRYAFKGGHTLYKHDFGVTELGISMKSYKVDALCWSMNYTYMKDMQLEMNRFPTKYDFQVFKYHAQSLRSAYESMEAVLEG
jgi:hypothetical protein